MVDISDKLVGMMFAYFMSGLCFGLLYTQGIILTQFERELILAITVLILILGFVLAQWIAGGNK